MTLATGARNGRWAGLIIEELYRLGLREVCIAPGSRSTPLTLAAARHHGLSRRVHFDERGLAFYALGQARATGRPAVVICTSGSAVANLHPAVVEAGMDRVPLLLLTADRPEELLETGANQTIDQRRLFASHVRWTLQLPAPSADYPEAALLGALDQAVRASLGPLAGPVHVNVPFREPLLADALPDIGSASPGSPWRREAGPLTLRALPRIAPDPGMLAAMTEQMLRAEAGLLVIGRLRDAAERAAAEALALRLGWPVHADIGSGLRASRAAAPWLQHLDQLLEADPAQPPPDCVLHLGGEFISKRLLQWLAAARGLTWLRVSEDPRRLDPAHRVDLRLEAALAETLAALPESLSLPRRRWQEGLLVADLAVAGALAEALDAHPALDEPAVARLVSRAVPADAVLALASSMPVRDMDRFADPRGAPVPVLCNRGASGIDGTLATACGHAAASGRRVLLLCGDLAFLHDLNSLALLVRQSPPVTVVLVNNDGGGIFSFLPVAAIGEDFEAWFGTPHGLDLGAMTRAFGLPWSLAQDRASFIAALTEALQAPESRVIEVRTEREANAARHRALSRAVAERLAALGPGLPEPSA